MSIYTVLTGLIILIYMNKKNEVKKMRMHILKLDIDKITAIHQNIEYNKHKY